MTHRPSSAPLVVDGVTVEPKWDWSPEYRAHQQRKLARNLRCPTHLTADDQRRRYAEFLAERDGISVDEALARLKAKAEAELPA